MVQPINYRALTQDPFAQTAQGVKFGAGLLQLQQEQQQNQLKLLQQQQALQQQQQYQQALARLQSPNATAQDFRNVALFGTKDQGANLLAILSNKTDQEKANVAKITAPITSALLTGNINEGIRLLEMQAQAAENSGDMEDATYIRQQIEALKADPKQATAIGQVYATQTSLVAPDMLERVLKLTAEQRANAEEARKVALQSPALRTAAALAVQEEAKAGVAEQLAKLSVSKADWDIKNLQDQITDRSLTRGLRAQEVAANVADKLSSISARAVDIPEAAQKLINEAATNAGVIKVSASQFNDLAKRLEAEGGGWGAAGSLSDWFSRMSGFEGGMTGLRQEYIRLRNTSAIKSLPPGPATDKDIQMALQGFPSATADAKVVASFLRGMAKLQDIDAAIAGAKVDWMSQNKGLMTRAKSDFVAGDYAAKPGEAWVDFSQRVAKDIAAKYGKAATAKDIEREKLISQIPTPRTPSPAGVNPIRQQADAIISGGK
jgi:protein-arginine kinase activator protein McsA